jgi:hypothetical protein
MLRLRGVDQPDDHVGVGQGPPGGSQQLLVEQSVGLVNPRRVEEQELRPGQILDSQDAVPGRLRPRRDDAQIVAHQPVDERGLPDVGPPDDGHIAGPKLRPIGWVLLGHGAFHVIPHRQ